MRISFKTHVLAYVDMAPTKVFKPRPSDQSEPLGSENPAPNLRPTNKSSTVIVNTPGDHTSTPVNTQIAPKNQSKSLIDNFLLKISNLVQKNNLTIIPHFKFSGSVGNLLPTYVASTADPVKMFTQDKRLAVFTTTKSLSSKSASGVQLKTGGTELTLHSQTLDQRPAPTCVTQLDGLTNFSNLPTALQLKTVKSSTGGNKGPEGTDLHQLMNHHALINDPMFCPLVEVHSADINKQTTVTGSSKFLPAYAGEETTVTGLSKFLPAYAVEDMTVTGSSTFLPACPREETLCTGPHSILAPSSTKPMLETVLDFSNSNSNKQTGKSGSVLSHPNSNKPTGKSGSVLSPPNLNKQTLQSRRVEFQPDKKQREYRTTYTTFHLQVLEKAFSKTQYPDFLTRAKLARKIGKENGKIQVV